MSTFVDKSGNTVAHFDKEYHDKYDRFGKEQSTLFYTWKGGAVSPFDKQSTKDHKEPDLKVEIVGRDALLVDAEVKSDRDWEFISRGIHIPARKFEMIQKYPSYLFVVCLVKGDGKQLLLVPKRALEEAQNVVGHRGFPGRNPTIDSDDYGGPGPNGTDKVFKWTIRGKNEHFLEVPEKWTSLWEVKEPGVDYIQVRDASMGKWLNGN